MYFSLLIIVVVNINRDFVLLLFNFKEFNIFPSVLEMLLQDPLVAPASLARPTAVYQGLILVLCCSAVWGQIVKESSDRYAYG